MINKEPDWVCSDCATERGAYMPIGHISSWHDNVCGLCNRKKEVTQPRDFGKMRGLLIIKGKK